MHALTLSDYEAVMTPNYGVPSRIIREGRGVHVTDVDGDTYLDMAGGIAVSAMGHCHPELVAALVAQANRVWHLSNTLANEPAIALAKALTEVTFADRVFFANSGAEANEAALKLARRAAFNECGPEKHEIICFENAFHGRTLFTVSAGGQPKYREGFGPLPGGFIHIPFNECAPFERAISEKTCAVMVEVVQGEGGVRPICPTLLEKIRIACDRVGARLIIDEVQTGMGRTGRLIGYQHHNITPDIVTSAKSLGCGFPIAAMLANEATAQHFTLGSHGSTYGGNPMGCAVALKALELINQPEMLSHVERVGAHLQAGLNALNTKYGLFERVRGRGLLLGCVLKPEFHGRAGELVKAALDLKMLCLIAGPNVLRLAPPLILSQANVDDALSRFDQIFARFEKDPA